MDIALDNGMNALAIAGQCTGLPCVGGAAIALSMFIQACDNIKIQREISKQLVKRATSHLLLLQENASKLEGTDLQSSADELEGILSTITKKLQRWSQYSFAKAYYKQKTIADSLRLYAEDLSRVETSFQLKCHIDTRAAVRDDAAISARDHAEIKDLLLRLITGQHNITEIKDLEAEEGILVAEQLMEDGESELYRHPRDSQKYLEYQRGLLNLHQATGVPPVMKDLSDHVERQGNGPVIGGTYSDVWIGLWLGQKKVALKGLRNVRVSKTAEKRFSQEINVWSKLQHENILPLLGFVTNLGPHIHTVSPWQDNGNILEFVKMNMAINRLDLLVGASCGLEYLHGLSIVHGNVKCANVLVNLKGVACVCDFGLSVVIGEIVDATVSVTLTAQGSARWLAPELIDGVISTPSFHSDVYSFSMAILELFTLQQPFANRKRDAAVIRDVVLHHARPPKPLECEYLSDSLWSLMQVCWDAAPDLRPAMKEVRKTLEYALVCSSPSPKDVEMGEVVLSPHFPSH